MCVCYIFIYILYTVQCMCVCYIFIYILYSVCVYAYIYYIFIYILYSVCVYAYIYYIFIYIYTVYVCMLMKLDFLAVEWVKFSTRKRSFYIRQEGGFYSLDFIKLTKCNNMYIVHTLFRALSVNNNNNT